MTEPTTETIGARVKRLREKIKVTLPLGEETTMTQEILARECKCDKGTISRIERNEIIPSLCLAKALARELGVTLDYLAEGC